MTDLEALYGEYFNDVYRYILRLSRDEVIAIEITSDTFFRAVKSINSFRGDCDVRVWLCQIAKNCYYSYLKKLNKIEPIGDDEIEEILDPRPNAAEEHARREEVERIQTVLHDVGEPYKEVFMWRVYAELSFREIAQIFKKTEKREKPRLYTVS